MAPTCRQEIRFRTSDQPPPSVAHHRIKFNQSLGNTGETLRLSPGKRCGLTIGWSFWTSLTLSRESRDSYKFCGFKLAAVVNGAAVAVGDTVGPFKVKPRKTDIRIRQSPYCIWIETAAADLISVWTRFLGPARGLLMIICKKKNQYNQYSQYILK